MQQKLEEEEGEETVAGAAVTTQAVPLSIRILPAAPATHQLALLKPDKTNTPGRNFLSISAVIP